jgi:hypothetical protein
MEERYLSLNDTWRKMQEIYVFKYYGSWKWVKVNRAEDTNVNITDVHTELYSVKVLS